MGAEYGDLPFPEAISFFKEKQTVPSEHWNDVWKKKHDTHFMVAGATKAELLDDLQKAVDKAINEGSTLAQFRKDFDKAAAKHGWEYNGDRNWRTKIIFQTNMRNAYAAGQYEQMTEPGAMKRRPYWVYRHGTPIRARVQHKAWSGTVRPANDGWFQTHFAPNGWGCTCYVESITRREADRRGGPSDIPNDGHYTWKDKQGKTHQVPVGIDPGWDYIPGASRQRQAAQKSMEKQPQPVQKAITKEVEEKKRFKPAKTKKEAKTWARAHDIADRADYTKLDLRAVNAMNESIFRHQNQFPGLRQYTRFIGSTQARNALEYRDDIKRATQQLKKKHGWPHQRARKKAIKKVKKASVRKQDGAEVTFNGIASGISINDDVGGDTDFMEEVLEAEVDMGHHPHGVTTLKAVFDHECGHLLVDWLGGTQDNKEVNALYNAWLLADPDGQELSLYAQGSADEFLAEGWAEYLNNPNPRKWAQRIGKLLLKQAKQRNKE
ncbi:MAG: hypothetical protein HQL53_11365 [Magnetococcales bacterium]|nr:hypothetical protein [Magnetococcales bacterium]